MGGRDGSNSQDHKRQVRVKVTSASGLKIVDW